MLTESERFLIKAPVAEHRQKINQKN